MKKLIFAATCVFASMLISPVFAADWTSPIQTSVTNVVAETVTVVQTNEVVITPAFVRLNTITIRNMPNRPTMIFVDWSWLDANSNVVNRGVKRFDQSQIEAKLEAAGTSYAAIQGLFTFLAAEDAVTPE